MSKKVDFPNADNIIRRYESGVSVKQLAEELGTSRTPLLRLLRDRGLPVRGRSDAERLKWASLKRNPAAVRRQCSAAWKARRGSKDPRERQIARALTRYHRLTHRGANEDALADCLRERGFQVAQQFPARNYNLDIAFESERVAVELMRSNMTRRAATTSRERMEYLVNSGWCVLTIVDDPRSKLRLALGSIAQQVIAVVKLRRRRETFRGEYGMIRRDGEPLPRPRHYLDHLPYIFR